MFIMEELAQMTDTSIADYLAAKANRVDLVMITTMTLAFFMRATGNYAFLHWIMSIGVIFVSIRLLYMVSRVDHVAAHSSLYLYQKYFVIVCNVFSQPLLKYFVEHLDIGTGCWLQRPAHHSHICHSEDVHQRR